MKTPTALDASTGSEIMQQTTFASIADYLEILGCDGIEFEEENDSALWADEIEKLKLEPVR